MNRSGKLLPPAALFVVLSPGGNAKIRNTQNQTLLIHAAVFAVSLKVLKNQMPEWY